MNSAFRSPEEELGAVEERGERTLWLWLGIAALVVIIGVALWAWPQPAPAVSKVLAKHILFEFIPNDPADRARVYELAQGVRKRLVDGESFSRLAKQYSQDELSARRGGSLGWGTPEQYEGAVEEYVWSGPIGQVSEILQTKYGFHIVVVEERLLSEVDQYKAEKRDAKKATETGAQPEE